MNDVQTKHISFHSTSEIQTEQIGEAIGSRIERGLCICLVGALGCGKTVMARGICRGLGVEEAVVSPSFILCEEYSARLPVVHNDLYRLEHETEIEALGVFDRVGADSVMLVEWGDRSPRLLEVADVVIRMTITGECERRIDVEYDAGDAAFFGDVRL